MPRKPRKPRTRRQKRIMSSAASLLLLVGLSSHSIGDKCGGSDRWDVKVLSDTSAHNVDLRHPIFTSIAGLDTFRPPVWKQKLKRQPAEMNAYTIECEIEHYKWENDDDIHFQLVDGSHQMVGELPDPFCPDAVASGNSRKYDLARKHFDAVAAHGEYKNHRFRITGVLHFDQINHASGGADNGAELHPITKLEVIH